MIDVVVSELLVFAGLGIIGGVMRIAVEWTGMTLNEKMSSSGALLYIATAIVVGALCGVILGIGKISAFLGGYAGLDVIDGIYNTAKKAKVSIKKKK